MGRRRKKFQTIGFLSGAIALTFGGVVPVPAVAQQLGALAPANLAMPRPQAPFFLTGTWQHDLRQPGSWRFIPDEFTLTPEAQAHYDAGQAAMAEGKIYRDDIGQCWPSGLPLIMTRVWPIAMIQLPTAIYMVSNFMNSLRIIYLDGREHTDPDIVVPSFTASRSAVGKATRLSSIPAISPGTTTGWIRGARPFPPARNCTSSSVFD